MAEQTGVAEQLFRALADAGVNLVMITTGEIKISVLVNRDQAQHALVAAHAKFDLDKLPAGAATSHAPTMQPKDHGDAADVLNRLQHMEELTIDDILLDESQARVTISGVPDHPGVAARVFEEVSAGGVFVDMIVQSYAGEGTATLSWTVPKTELDACVEIANRLTTELDCAQVTSSPDVAKLSVSGIGLRSHTGVAITMFKALTDANINLDLINTSEVRVNVLVDGASGKQALAALEQAFEEMRK
jgi:aspartate kinase